MIHIAYAEEGVELGRTYCGKSPPDPIHRMVKRDEDVCPECFDKCWWAKRIGTNYAIGIEEGPHEPLA